MKDTKEEEASTNVKNSLFLNPVTEVEMLQLVAKVKPKKSKGHDELDMCLMTAAMAEWLARRTR